MKSGEKKKKMTAWIVFGGMWGLAPIIVRRAVWMNIWGLLTAIMGVLPLIGYTLSPASNADQLSTYEPLNVFESWFDGAHMEIVSRDVLTGTDLSSPNDFDAYFRFEKEVKAVCWSSLGVWILLVLVIVFSVKLAKRRKAKHFSAAVPVLIGWMFIALVPYICAVTVAAAGYIKTANVFYGTEICALIFFLVVWNHDGKKVPEWAGQEEPQTQTLEERPPENWYTCPTCGRLVRKGNSCSRCAPMVGIGESEPEPEPETAPIRYCRKCGAPLLPDGRFCTKCGTEIVK